MAYLLHFQERLDEAEVLYRDALEKRRRALGDESVGTLTSIHNMGTLRTSQGRWEEAEPTITTDPAYAYCYAMNTIRGRWEEAEPVIMTDPEAAYKYARDVIGGRWEEAEPVILTDPRWAYLYAHLIVDK